MKEQRFEKVVEWEFVSTFILGLIFIIFSFLAIYSFPKSDISVPFKILSSMGITIAIIVGFFLTIYSLNQRKVYWRKIK